MVYLFIHLYICNIEPNSDKNVLFLNTLRIFTKIDRVLVRNKSHQISKNQNMQSMFSNICTVDLEISSVHFSSVAQSCLTLRPHELQHAKPPCPSPTPGVHWDSRPSSQWCHSAISASVVPISSCPQSLPASESFPMSQLFAWGGQS